MPEDVGHHLEGPVNLAASRVRSPRVHASRWVMALLKPPRDGLELVRRTACKDTARASRTYTTCLTISLPTWRPYSSFYERQLRATDRHLLTLPAARVSWPCTSRPRMRSWGSTSHPRCGACTTKRAAYVKRARRACRGDAAAFTFTERFGLVSRHLMHSSLPSVEALTGCFQSTFDVLASGGCSSSISTQLWIQRWAASACKRRGSGSDSARRRHGE